MNFPPITLATNNGDMGGGEVMLLRVAEVLRKLGINVHVVAPSQPSGLADEATAAGLQVTRLPASTRREWMVALRRWDARHEPTRAQTGRGILWCNGLVPAVATAGHRQRIVHLHQAPLTSAQHAVAPLARIGALATLVPSAYMQTVFHGSRVLPNWTGPATINVSTPPRSERDSRQVIGFLGRLSTDKGVTTLAEAIRILDRRQPGRYRLLVAGEPRFVDPSDYAIVDGALAGLGELAQRPGWMDRDEFFSRIDVLAVPSLFKESFGLTAAEAMAAKVPVVVSADGALPEVVGPFGVTVPPGDAEALAGALDRELDHEHSDATQPRLDALHNRWEQHFSPEAGKRHVEALLRELRAAHH